MPKFRLPFRSRAAIIGIIVVILVVSVAVISRLHPTASTPHVSTEASVLHFKYGAATTEVKPLPDHRFSAAAAAPPALPQHPVVQHLQQHHSVSGSKHYNPYAHHEHHAKHGGSHPITHAVPRHGVVKHPAPPAQHAGGAHVAFSHPHGHASSGGLRHPAGHRFTALNHTHAASGHHASVHAAPATLAQLKLEHAAAGAALADQSAPAAGGGGSRFQKLEALAGVELSTSAYLAGTAIVTMATGDENARLALALVQSLRDVKTRVPHIVVLLSRGGIGSRHCNDYAWRVAHGRQGVDCSGPNTIAAEIISEEYLAAFKRLGAEITIIDPIPDTPYTKAIPGGRQVFWGMA